MSPGAETQPGKVVVVGAGMTAFHLVTALRAQGHRGGITVLGDEPHAPYDRPPLSKEVLRGERESTTFVLDWTAEGVDLRLSCAALALRAGEVDTDQGPVPFDALVIATGARPRALPGDHRSGRVGTLRTIDDSLALRAEFTPGRAVVIVGGGWIGAEVATAASAAGCTVTVVEAADTILPAVVPAGVSDRIHGWYADAGVGLVLSGRVVEVGEDWVLLEDGRKIDADVVVAGIGAVPNTEWLAGSAVRLAPDGGVLTDEALRTSMAGVYAAGDCVSYPSRRFDERLRVEHWTNAQQSAEVVAGNILGATRAHDPVPYFWSHQFGRMVQYVGHHGPDDQVTVRGAPGAAKWSVCWTADDKLTGVLAVSRAADIAQGRAVIESGAPVFVERLADTSQPLRTAVKPTTVPDEEKQRNS